MTPARTAGSDADEAGVTLFAVERDAAGLSASPERLTDSSIAARLELDGVDRLDILDLFARLKVKTLRYQHMSPAKVYELAELRE